MSPHVRSVLVVIVGAVGLVFAAKMLTEMPGYRIPKDFPEYYTAGALNLRGENPYDPVLMLEEQRKLEPSRDEALMMWNPPPALALDMPLALLPVRLAGLLWVGIQLLAVLVGCDLLGRQYDPSGRRRWLAPLAGFLFVGTWWMVAYGQNTALIVLGLAGFLHYTKRKQPVAAGVCAALTALKPHLLAAFGVLLVADLVSRRGRLALLAGGSAIAAALGLVLLANPDVIVQYLAATRDPGPHAVSLRDWAVPMPAYWLRMALAPDRFWLQFLPCLLGCVVLLSWRIRERHCWDWGTALPVVIAVAVLTAPYGWIFDMTVLLVPVVVASSRLASAQRWGLLVVLLAGQIAITVVSLATAGALQNFWWVAPAVLALTLPGWVMRVSCASGSTATASGKT